MPGFGAFRAFGAFPAAAWLRTSLEGLQVDAGRMRANLGDNADVGSAGVFVDRALEAAA